ncbi:MAG: hypothetical protein M1816_006365 [Peltula sp. TS41687]|nr:MAG: hypothetical protein M1816_006365 [Peltula sp. TS41687]
MTMDSLQVNAGSSQEYNPPTAQTPAVPQLRSETSESSVEYPSNRDVPDEGSSSALKQGKRRFFGLGKKKLDENKEKDPRVVGSVTGSNNQLTHPTSAPFNDRHTTRSTHPYHHASPPPNRHCNSPSPGLPSPASSQIFERDVQEATLTAPTSPGVPSHITTENHIPPVLEASSLAITDDHLDPDEVKIVTHASHQPAALTVTGPSSIEASVHTLPDEPMIFLDKEDAASVYGHQDVNDVRRLSFISFADVVHAEHAEQSSLKDSIHLQHFPRTSSPINLINRSPSPVQSRASSQGLGTSPPTSGPTSVRGSDVMPGLGIKSPGSLGSASSPPLGGGELAVETMRQALRKTGSTDLVSGLKSQPLSAVSAEIHSHDVPWS